MTMDANGTRSLAEELHEELASLAVPQRAEAEKRYLRSELVHLGVSVPDTRKVARKLLRTSPGIERRALLELVQELWAREVHELRMLAVELLCFRVETLEPDDLAFVERLLRDARTWALVDPLAVKVVGTLSRKSPRARETLARWARDDDFWLRRAVLLSFLEPLRKGDEEEFRRFSSYADEMLPEREFFIRKAIGWVLREYAKSRAEEVFEWLLPRAGRTSGLTLREASKHFSPQLRQRLHHAAKGG